MSNIKGTSFFGRLQYVRRYHGEGAVERVLAAMADQAMASQLRRGALRSAWYPFAAYVDLNECVDRVCGRGDGSLPRAMAAQVAEDDLASIYRAFLRVASPSFVLRHVGQIWKQYHDSGRVVVLRDEPAHVDLEVVGFDTPHHVHCDAVGGWMERCVQMTGVKGAKVTHPSCRARGADRCLYEVRWQA